MVIGDGDLALDTPEAVGVAWCDGDFVLMLDALARKQAVGRVSVLGDGPVPVAIEVGLHRFAHHWRIAVHRDVRAVAQLGLDNGGRVEVAVRVAAVLVGVGAG